MQGKAIQVPREGMGRPGPEAITGAPPSPHSPPHYAVPGALPPIGGGAVEEEGRLTGELLLELPDQSCCLLLLLRLLKPLALELRQKPEVED